MKTIRLINAAAMPHKLYCTNADCEHINDSLRQLVWPVDVQGHKDNYQFWCYICIKHAPRVAGDDIKPDLSLKWIYTVQVIHHPDDKVFAPCQCLEHEPDFQIVPNGVTMLSAMETRYLGVPKGDIIQSVTEYWCYACVERAQSDEDRQYVVA